MHMSYSKNPNLPKVRIQVVKMVRAGHSTREGSQTLWLHT